MKAMPYLFIFALASCMGNNYPDGRPGGGDWPTKWSADMSVSIGENGGMQPEWWDINIAGDSATYKYNYDQHEVIAKVKLSKSDLDSIAYAIYKAQPHRVKMREHGIIYDKGTTYATMRHKQRILTLAESATESFTKSGWENFRLIFGTVNRIVMREAEKSKINVTVEVNCKGSNQYWCYLQLGNRGGDTFGCADTARSKVYRLFPGSHSFFGYVFRSENGEYKYPQKTWSLNSQGFTVLHDTTIRFDLKDSVFTAAK